MRVLVEIRTPKGEAASTSRRISKFILPSRLKCRSWVGDADDIIYWEVEGSVRDCLKVNRNVAYYDTIMRGALSSWMVKHKMKGMPLADRLELEDMLLNQTTLTIIKTEQQDEKDEYEYSWWDKIKQRFHLI